MTDYDDSIPDQARAERVIESLGRELPSAIERIRNCEVGETSHRARPCPEGDKLWFVSAIDGIPEMTRCISMWWNAPTHEAVFVLEHESFPVTEPGAAIPRLEVTMKTEELQLTEGQVTRLVMDKMVRQQ